ncbi:hypothetical protein T459_08314 [Capsicum annuum]|uniref:Uncharacterized protein n=1 Tax=Capsicum annuum TaxID=4072 RepID=A0A2G2ZW65_CAPAN|nr:hypothetical protein T459_08314 [Capsicum annuum]
MKFKIQKLSPSLRFITLTAIAVSGSFLDLLFIISTLDAASCAGRATINQLSVPYIYKKGKKIDVIERTLFIYSTDVDSVASNVESVATDMESVVTDVESIITDVESVAIDVESVAIDLKSVGIYQTSLAGALEKTLVFLNVLLTTLVLLDGICGIVGGYVVGVGICIFGGGVGGLVVGINGIGGGLGGIGCGVGSPFVAIGGILLGDIK